MAWDFENDGVIDARGASVQYVYPTSGRRIVVMQVTKGDGAVSEVSKAVVVEAPPSSVAPPGVFPQQPRPQLMSPFPIVRIVGRATRRGATIRLLSVRNAPRGARVTVRCRGRGCPLRSHRRSTKLGRARLRPLERSLPAGILIRIYVTQPGKIGKYTSFRIRRMRRPLRRDRCTRAGLLVAQRCPAS